MPNVNEVSDAMLAIIESVEDWSDEKVLAVKQFADMFGRSGKSQDLDPKKVERLFQIFHDVKKELHYIRRIRRWVWTDQGEAIHDGFAGWDTAIEAMQDACAPYMKVTE